MILIVLSVLFAFGVEARWSASQERSEDEGYIRSVAAELEGKRADLIVIRNTATASIEAIDSLAQYRADPNAEDVARLPGLVWGATTVSGLAVSVVAVESLTQSSAWARATSPEFQLAVSSFIESMEGVATATDQAQAYWFGEAEPFLRTRIDYAEWERGFLQTLTSAPGPEWHSLVMDREFWNLLVHQRWFSEGAVDQADNAIGLLDDAIRLIQGPAGTS